MSEFIVLIAPQGGGKGTIAKGLARHGFIHVSMSELLKRDRVNGTAIDEGTLLPDEVVMGTLCGHLDNLPDGRYVVEGCPRTVGQAERLISYLQTAGHRYIFVIIEVSREESIRRIRKRLVEEHRDDDIPDRVEKRLVSYYENLPGIFDTLYDEGHGLTKFVKGEGKENEVLEKILMVCGISAGNRRSNITAANFCPV